MSDINISAGWMATRPFGVILALILALASMRPVPGQSFLGNFAPYDAGDSDDYGQSGYGSDEGLAALPFAAAPQSSREAVPPLNLRFAEVPPSQAEELQQDLTVMTKILQNAVKKSIEDSFQDYRQGLEVLSKGDPRSLRALYLDGFGAIFMIKMRMPLLGPPKKVVEKTSGTDTEWERARRELAGQPLLGAKPRSAAQGGIKYDPRLVELLEEGLVSALKQAANIRHLKSDERIAIFVFGSPSDDIEVITRNTGDNGDPFGPPLSVTVEGKPRSAKGATRNSKNETSNSRYEVWTSADFASQQGTVMSIRATKQDIDAFAKGLALAEFRTRVRTNRYFGPGYNVASLNSWAKPAPDNAPNAQNSPGNVSR